jgi:signal transduction histidine kinase
MADLRAGIADKEIARVRDELRRAQDRVEQLEAVTSAISHDLRAPLHAITCFAQSLQETESAGMSSAGQHRLDRVVQGALRMNRMIDDLLACSRAERHDLRTSDIDLAALACDVVSEMRPAYWRSRAEIGALPCLRGDGVLLRQVFANLIGNAFKFSARHPAPCVRIAAADLGREVEIRVHDNGAGFDPTYAPRLFNPFQRLHNEREFPGTGMGLAIVKRIVARHGGRVRAESQPGVCTTFAFTLPKIASPMRAQPA